MFRFVCCLMLLVASGSNALADVKLHGLFTDHMVLQQKTVVPIWGKADPGEKINVLIQKDGASLQQATATAGDDGKWMVKLNDLPAGGPYVISITGKNTIKLEDVLVGEVWICSGQSNMEWPVSQSKDAKETAAQAANKNLRMFRHKKVTSGKPLEHVQMDRDWNQWRVATPETVPGFSAVGYFFGAALQKARNVPVGIIQTAWGGTPAEAWTTTEFLEKTPELAHYSTNIKKQVEYFETNVDEIMKQHQEKVKQFQIKQKEYKEKLKEYEQAADTSKMEKPKAPTGPGRTPQHPDLSPNSPSRLYNAMIQPLVPYAIKGAIWYQGESNAGRAYEYRTLFPAMIQSWRSAWNSEFPFLFVQLAPFRKIVDQPQESDWAELREAQLLTSRKLAGTAQAVITDTTDAATDQTDIHPKNKAPVGQRLALAALQKVYGESVVGSGPVYEKYSVDGDKIKLSFSSIGTGLECKGEKLTGFTIAGVDKQFYNADARIEGDTVVVSSPAVKEPVAVRFGWCDYPVVNLFNKEGIPASPFRTDDWRGKTWPKEK